MSVAHVPLVSIVLPTYNGECYLLQSIQSCLSQTHTNLELIIVDDCSSDSSPEIIHRQAILDPRIRVIRHENNRRLPTALNTGFAASRGEFLTWTSDDNLYEPDAIRLMVDHLSNRPSVGLVYCNYTIIGPMGEVIGMMNNPDPARLVAYNVIGACFLYRRKVYETIGGYDPSMFIVEDYDYWLRIYKHFPIEHIPLEPYKYPPYKYRQHPNSLTSKKYAEQFIKVAQLRCRDVVPPPQRKKELARGYRTAYGFLRGTSDQRAAWECARVCFALQPMRLSFFLSFSAQSLRLSRNLLSTALQRLSGAIVPMIQI